MKDVFLADAHLLDPADGNYRRLLEFFESLRGRTRTLYLLGDIFEFWIGYRHSVFAPYVPVLEALRRLREDGARIVYVEGNHDFHMGPYFRETLDCQVLPDGGSIRIDGCLVHISHGDLVNSADHGYRRLRMLLRSAPMRLVIKLVPPDWAWGISRWASRQSRKGHEEKRRRWVPEQMLENHARQRFAEGHQAVITGHFHAPLFREFDQGPLIGLGDWITQYSYATCENGRFELHTFKGE
ncbi:UDP-2,3-diacylglucosamine hydrolase [Desulfuromonas versatilis]|uniref:UDP-2,3-diacylglucosamine hydrolase n=1 Tax=Desulfuromonas versatilis TaxID=2802975 RepID=A0ABN6E255_9BACT|nr:UDP-2,3-diacylglucosamine diphosphatase [Desulfuromonas versatilis]BCR05599.1 UDP-2,3-diacylglucosamine hydrolase [Desulfuromonas versatilis]